MLHWNCLPLICLCDLLGVNGPNDWGYILFSLWSIYDFLSLINHCYDSFFNNFGWTGQVYLHVYRQKTRLLDSDSDCVMIYMTNTYKKRRRHQISLISMSTWIYICQHCENCGFTLRIFSFTIFFFNFLKILKICGENNCIVLDWCTWFSEILSWCK